MTGPEFVSPELTACREECARLRGVVAAARAFKDRVIELGQLVDSGPIQIARIHGFEWTHGDWKTELVALTDALARLRP